MPLFFRGQLLGTNFSWQNDVASIGLATNGNGDLLSFAPNNNGFTDIVATITVTPEANGCAGTPKNFTLTILPTASVIQPLNQFQCNGETTSPVIFLGPVAGTNFTWTNNQPAIGLPASGSGNLPAFVMNNPGNTPIVAAITVTASTNSCTGITKTFYFTVDPSPAIQQPPSQRLCNGETVTATTFSGTIPGTTYSWINSATAIGLPANGTGDVPSFVAHNNTAFPITAIIQVTGSANSCGSVVRVFTITVNPTATVDATPDKSVCNGVMTSETILTGTVSGTSYSWTNDQPSIGLAATGSGNIAPFLAVNHSTMPVTAKIIVFGATNGSNCAVAIDTFLLTVHPSPMVNAHGNKDVCLGSSAALSATGASTYSWVPLAGLSCADCANPTATPGQSISYVVTGTTNAGCTASDSTLLTVRQPFVMRASPNDTICSGRTINLRAENADHYVWSPATGLSNIQIAAPIATPLITTNYQVIGFDAFHCFTDTAIVTIVVGQKPTVNIGADMTVTNGAPVTFHPVIANGPIVRYTWSPAAALNCSDCEQPTATIRNNVMYTVQVENSLGCQAVDSIFITAFCQKSEVFVPNAFTPDGDGLNDILMVRGNGITVKSFRIFNRWGVIVFEKKNFSANDPKYGWDGRVKSVAATPDVYVYTAEVICDNGAIFTYKGNTTIIK